MSIQIIKQFSECQCHITAWDDLAQSAVEPNVFYESWNLLPALNNLAQKQHVFLLLIWSEDCASSQETPQLIGIFPLYIKPNYGRLPVRCYSLWKHPHCFLCTPLIRAGQEKKCITELLSWFDASSPACRILRLSDVRADGPFLQKLEEVLRQNRRQTDYSCYERALLQSNLDGDKYIRQALSRKSRSEFERQGRRLAALGQLQVRHLTQQDDIEEWLTTLLQLEKQGWKGRAGTAIGCNQQETHYLKLIIPAAFKRQQLMMSMMLLDGQPIAIRCSFVRNGAAFAFKTAFDEKYGKYSPGVQLEFAVTKSVLENPKIDWMDSCSDPEHSLFNRLWTEKRMLYHVGINRRDLGSAMLIRTTAILRKLLRR